jgi:hypothetical protein
VKITSPFESVGAVSTVPTSVWPSSLRAGAHSSLAKTSIREVRPGVELSVPATLVPPGKTGVSSSGKFWRLFAPVSASLASFASTTPTTPRT